MKRNHALRGGLSFWFLAVMILILAQGSSSGNPTSLKEHTIEVNYCPKGGSLTQEYEIFIADNGNATIYKEDHYSKDWYGDFKYTVNYSKPKVYASVKSAKIPEEELNDLKRMILDANVFGFKDEYLCSTSTLGYRGELVTFVIDGKTKKILISASSFPVELGRIIRKIEEIKENIENLPS
jgi:hypothetical protein